MIHVIIILTIDGNHLVLHFTLPVLAKVDTRKEVVLDVYDPSFFVDFRLFRQVPGKTC